MLHFYVSIRGTAALSKLSRNTKAKTLASELIRSVSTNVIFIHQLFKNPEFYHKSEGCIILRVIRLIRSEVILEALGKQDQKIEFRLKSTRWA